MTDQLFRPAPSAQPGTTVAPLLPAERVGRWVLHRAGIINVWQYDRTELSFAGGRVLLRGKNGAGKSKALEVLLPFLLDADTRAMDATGRDRTTVYWLMTDGREAGNHVGYVWLELRMTSESGEERFCTLGAGLKASTSTRQPATWFFLTEDARVGVDLHLNPTVSVEKLKERLGAESVTTAAEHRRRVATHLFGLHDEMRYSNLLHLLRRLRDPNIGNRIEAGELAAVLRDALPPPSGEALEKAADRFDTLEQVREQLARTERTAAVLARFLDTYRSYARGVLGERCHAVLGADAEHRRAAREAKRLAGEAEAAVRAQAAADAEVEHLFEDESRARVELEGLQASEAYKDHLHLDDRRRAVAAKLETARIARQSAEAAGRAARQAADDVERAAERAAEAERRVNDGRAVLVRLAREAGIDQAVVPRQADAIAPAVAVADGRRRAAAQVRVIAERAAETAVLAAQADARAARSEQELSARQSQADEANSAWVTESGAWRQAVTDWTHAERPDLAGGELGPPPDWGRLYRAMGEGGAVAEELAEVSELAVALLLPLREAARGAESGARADVREAERALKEMEAERARLEAEEEARPPVSRFLGAERDERAGSPFYELVDFVPDLDGPARAGLEAALEASGLLDAWVAGNGLVVHPSTHDVILRLDAPVLPEGVPTLADALTAPRPEVARLLRTVGLGDSGDNPWMATDGRWSLGPLRGAWSKVEAEYLGAGARRATRDRRLAETTRRCAELSAALAGVSARFEAARGVRERLDNLPATLPPDTLVRRSASTALALAGVASDALSRAEEDRRSAQQARTTAAQVRSELTHAASLDSLPVTMDGLSAVERAASDMARELHGWERLWAEWGGRTHEVAELTARHAERVVSADAAASDASALEQQHGNEMASLAALEDAIGASVAQVLAAVDACRAVMEAAQQALPPARERAGSLGVKAGSALAQASTAAAAVEVADSAVTASGERLQRAAVLPGVSVAACGVEWEWDGSGVVDAARALQARVAERPEGGAASDQVVLNRYRELEDGLAGGYDVVASEDDGVKYFHVVDDTGRQPLPAVAARVATEAEQTRGRLLADEREVIERFLLGELGEEIRERLLESHDLVLAANRALAGVRTSHGKGAHLNWQIDPEAPPAARVATQLLVMAPRATEEDARLRDALMDLIRAQREKDPSLGYLAHLREALDYRYWHRFSVQAVDDARPGSTRVLSSRLGLSQGEQRVLSYLALFAAAAAHFDGLGASCPRLLLLDDAFAKVDEPTHGRLLELLIELDLDFVMTSERMWGCFPEVPSLEIYEALREPLVPGVALVHFRWDGRQRHLIGM
jgi:uncharacterized protein (TIGR02680 family)